VRLSPAACASSTAWHKSDARSNRSPRTSTLLATRSAVRTSSESSRRRRRFRSTGPCKPLISRARRSAASAEPTVPSELRSSWAIKATCRAVWRRSSSSRRLAYDAILSTMQCIASCHSLVSRVPPVAARSSSRYLPGRRTRGPPPRCRRRAVAPVSRERTGWESPGGTAIRPIALWQQTRRSPARRGCWASRSIASRCSALAARAPTGLARSSASGSGHGSTREAPQVMTCPLTLPHRAPGHCFGRRAAVTQRPQGAP
jgi:hypothetical protein